jgi:hypothetical protein
MPMQYWQKFPTGTQPKKSRPQQSKNWLLSLTNTSNRQSLISSYLSKTRKKTTRFAKFLQIHDLSFRILAFDFLPVVIPPIPNLAKVFHLSLVVSNMAR